MTYSEAHISLDFSRQKKNNKSGEDIIGPIRNHLQEIVSDQELSDGEEQKDRHVECCTASVPMNR